MFFQWRQSRGGAEKFHSAMVLMDPHSSRIFRECAIRQRIFATVGYRWDALLADVVVVFDWENWWALELDAKPSTLKYIHQLRSLYAALKGVKSERRLCPSFRIPRRLSFSDCPKSIQHQKPSVRKSMITCDKAASSWRISLVGSSMNMTKSILGAIQDCLGTP